MILGNIHLNDNESLGRALSRIFGIGNYVSKKICIQSGLVINLKVASLSKEQQVFLAKILTNLGYLIHNDLKLLKRNKIIDLVKNRSYRGYRHTKGYPVRGQRTRTNASTSLIKKFK
uniref:Ribosomal protein S13 n=1 Tax=Gloeochaete wittrockiana TaxID=38269 RepID=A0A096Y6T7_9EUKA|nr:ribosomal protein S13 [Gloeochaete wittrockiana]AIM52043.1 ribosomal protein S13 [Gloeochaete wittrockiana]